MADEADDLLSIGEPVQPAAQPVPTAPNPVPPRTAGERARGAAGEASEDEHPNKVDTGTLIIGADVSFVGEIKACNRLVVDGIVEATLQRCHEVLIGERGVFKGKARTENAEVYGRIDGEFIVRRLLRIRAVGQVSGTTTYGEIEIERGGRIIGQAEAREGSQRNRE